MLSNGDELLNILNLVSDLDEEINKKFDKFAVITTIYCDGFLVRLVEQNNIGYDFQLFNSEDPFDDDIDEFYENNQISYEKAVLTQIKANIIQITSDFSELRSNLSEITSRFFK